MSPETKECPECGSQVGRARLARHLSAVHGATPKDEVARRFEKRREEKKSELEERATKAGNRGIALKAGVAVVVVLLMVVAAYGATTYLNSIGVGGGKSAPDFSVTDSKGVVFRLSDHRGEVVVLFFMRGTWCLTCKASIPGLLEVYNGYKARGMTMITISTDTGESDGMVENYKSENGTPWTYAIDRTGVQAAYAAYQVESHFVIDKTGKVTYNSSSRVSGEALSKQVEVVI